MPESRVLLFAVILLALAFDFSNGLNDAANAIATSISTRVLSPLQAIAMAAVLNFVGALSGTAVAKTVGAGIVSPEAVNMWTVLAAVLTASLWVFLLSYYGMPISASHALVFGLVGAGVATGGLNVIVWEGVEKVILGLIFSPLIGFGVGLLLMVALSWLFRRSTPGAVYALFRYLQILSAAFMAFSHGNNDAQKTMGIMTLALFKAGLIGGFQVPIWVMVLAALAMALGTVAGGWRVIRTLGMRIVKLEPIHGFAAESTAGAIIEGCSRLGVPISTTHTITAAVMGVGASKRLSAVRWGVAADIVGAWVLTIPGCAAIAWGLMRALRPLVGQV